MIATGIAQATARSDVTLIAAALPVLLLSLVAAVSSSPRAAGTETRPSGSVQIELMPLPEWSDRGPRLVRTGIVVAGGAGACAMSVWVAHLAKSAGQSGVFVVAMLLAVGIGGLTGSVRTRIAPRSIGGFGIACLAAGAILMLGPVELIGVTLERHGDFAGATVVHLVLACSGLAAIGVAAAQGQQALLSRVASRSSAGATVLARALVCAALTVWIGAPIAQRLVGESATLLLPALAMLTIGAMLVTREPIRQAGTDIEQSKSDVPAGKRFDNRSISSRR